MLFAGMVYAWSVLSGPIAQEFPQWSKAQLSMAFTIVMIMFCLGSIVGGFLAEKVKARVYIWVSAFLFLAGFFFASRISTLSGLYISFGIICGFASGLAYNAVLGTVGKWFPDKQGFISGVLLMGFGLSSFLIGKVYQACTPDVIGAWRQSFLAIGVITSVVLTVCGFFLAKPEPNFVPSASDAENKRVVNTVGIEVSTSVMMTRPTFWLYYLWALVLGAAGLALVSQASGIVKEVNACIAPGTLATLAGLVSVSNGIGRVIMGSLFDRIGRSATMQSVNTLFILAGFILSVALKTGSVAANAVGFILGGMAYGGIASTNSAFISSYFGMKHYPQNFSVANTNLIAASFGGTIAGALYDATSSYSIICYLLGGIALLGVVFSIAIGICDKKLCTANLSNSFSQSLQVQ